MTRELREIAADAGVSVWLHARRLDGSGAEIDLDGREPVATASLYKLPLALVWAELVTAGELDPLAPIHMPSGGRLPGATGVSMLLDDVTLTARDSIRLMLAVSDNASADALIAHIGRDRLNQHLVQLGLPGTVVRHGSADAQRELMHDMGAATPGAADILLADPDHDRVTREHDPALSSASTAAESCEVLARLWAATSTADSSTHACVRDAMGRQVWRHRIGSGFPHDDVGISGKTGTLGRLRHEAAVVEFPHERPVAVAVLTRAVRNERHLPRVDAAIGELARVAVTALRLPSD